MTDADVIEELGFVPYDFSRLESFTVSVCLLVFGES
jgi:hypothetical protein